MKVEVLFFAQLRELAGIRQRTFVLDAGARLKALLDMLDAEYAGFRHEVETLEGLRVLIGEREYGLDEALETALSEGDTVVFLPPIAGG